MLNFSAKPDLAVEISESTECKEAVNRNTGGVQRTELLEVRQALVHAPPQLRPLGELVLSTGLH